MGMGNNRIEPGTEIAIRIKKRPEALDPKSKKEFN